MNKRYIVKRCYGGATIVMDQAQFNAWVREMAATNYNQYRIVGDQESGHYWLDFDNMYEITEEVVD